MTQSSTIEVAFTKQMIKIPGNIDLKTLEYQVEPGIWRPVLTLEILPAKTQNPDLVGMDYEIVSISSTLISF